MKRTFTVYLILVALTSVGVAQERPARPTQPTTTNAAALGNRFLFIVDTSASMLQLEHAGRQAVFDMIYYGVDAQMRSGDTFGVWTFNEDVYGGIYPMQTYNPQLKLQLASSAGVFLRQQKYEKKPRIDTVLAKTSGLIKAVKDVNIFIVSSSETLVDTTSWNTNATRHTSTNLLEAQQTKKPVVLTLVARNGEVVSSGMTVAGEPIALPIEAPKPPTPEPAATTPPIAAVAPETNSRPAIKNIIISRETVSAASSNLLAQQASLSQKPESTSSVPNTNVATAVVALPPTNEVAVAAPITAQTPNKGAASLLPAMHVAAREQSTNNSASAVGSLQPGPAMIAPPTLFTPQKLFWAGALMVFFAGGLIAGLAWQNRPKRSSSYISRSLGPTR